MGGGISAYLQLMRMKNVILASITVPLGAQFAVGDSWASDQLTEVITQILAVIFFIGAGNTMNDIKDIAIDKEAHPERPLAAELISLENAKKFAYVLWILSISFVTIGAYLLHSGGESPLELVTIYIVAVALMITYDHGPTLKNTGLKGNVAISIMVGAVILYGASSVGNLWTDLVWWTAGVVFFANLAREIIKDCQDMEADQGIRTTLPMSLGLVKSRMLAYVVVMAALVCLYIPYWQGPFQFNQLIFQTPAILMLITLNRELAEGNDYQAASKIRIAMLLGLVGFIVPMQI
ncbi:MAG TPA: UbiA family prenyltransferase [Candidatus Poseidoniaceae archaeon]|nr:UbiA family prenyltransferase [Candidatus Poseidoniaceae archaeon]